MAILFGLDMKEFQWYKFGSKYMFGNKDYHLRRTKFIVYQLALIFCVISESLGTDVLSNLVDAQKYFARHHPGAVEHNDSYVGMASFNIFAGIYVAFVFGAAFFFDLIWPARHEDRGIRIAWKGAAIAACVFMLASCICEIVIVATRTAYITGVDGSEAQRLIDDFDGYPLQYNQSARAITSVVFAWLGLVFGVIPSTIVMWMSINHIERAGPYARHVRCASNQQGKPDNEQEMDGAKDDFGGATEMNNVRGNHYEPPGVHVSPEGKEHEDPAELATTHRGGAQSNMQGVPQRPPTGERTYTGT